MKTEKLKAEDGQHISVCFWDEVANPKGVLQIVHGMAEHVRRYDDFAQFMNRNGFIVVGDDHRAHGKTSPDALGKEMGGDLFTDTVNDERMITKTVAERFKLPVVILGHSYGSFIVQLYMAMGAKGVSGVILSGSAAMEGITVDMAYRMAFKRCAKGKGDEPGKTFAKQTFEKYDKKIKDGINGWLSRDPAQVGKYNTDPECNFICSNAFYKFFFGGLKYIAADKGKNIPKNLKLMIASGDMDGVGGFGKLVTKLKERYEGFGLTPQFKLYPGARHELINETNKDEVYADFLAFAESCLVQ